MSNGLFFKQLTIDGYDYSSYKDFAQPTIKSYIKYCDDETSACIFEKGIDISDSDFTEAYSISIYVTDLTGTAVVVPSELIKVYVNAFNETDISNSDMPFTYLMSYSFEFMTVER